MLGFYAGLPLGNLAVVELARLGLLVLVMFALFVSGALLGFLAAIVLVLYGEADGISVLQQIAEGLPIPRKFYSLETALTIFIWNLRVTLIGIALGVLVVVPSVIVFVNGVVLGFVVALVAYSPGFSVNGLLLAVAATVPHGILEIPAVLVSTAVGTNIGIEFWRYILRGRRDIEKLVKALKTLAIMLPIVVLLLLLASIVETFVTPYIVETLFSIKLP